MQEMKHGMAFFAAGGGAYPTPYVAGSFAWRCQWVRLASGMVTMHDSPATARRTP